MRRLKLTLFALVSLLLCSCSAYKKVPYLQGSEYLNMANVQTPLYDAHIMPKDLLTITVNTSDPDAAIPFNLTVATPITANSKGLTSQPALQQYLVDNNGNIDFPVLGTLHIGGLTKSQAENMYNPQIQISAESETKRSIFRKRDKTKRSKKESAQHSKSRNKSFVMTSVSAL